MTTGSRIDLRIDELRDQVPVEIITPSDAGYDEARRVHNGMFDRRPLAVLRAEQAVDVAAAIDVARTSGIELAVRGGGHGAPGYGTADDALVIDLARMNGVRVDPRTRTARVGGGATWGDVNRVTHAYGLATPGGFISTTGVGGLTLGGGIGYLNRLYGLVIDNLVSADVVTADGTIRTASATEHPDLFWAIRGGGGNFGVVTSFEFRLHPVKDVYVGLFFYELDAAGDLLRFFRDFIANAPDAYGGFPAFQVAPPLEFVPAERHGETLAFAVVHWAGELDQGEQAVQPFRDVAPVVAEMVGPMPYPALNMAFDAIFPKGIRSYWKGVYATELTDAAIEEHLRHGPQVPEVSAAMHLYPINGACHRVGRDETAFGHRDATFAPVIVAAWNDPAVDAERIGWVRDYHAALVPHSDPGGYVNFLADDDRSRVRDSFGSSYDRLVEIKSIYDPGNLFHLNPNVPPRT